MPQSTHPACRIGLWQPGDGHRFLQHAESPVDGVQDYAEAKGGDQAEKCLEQNAGAGSLANAPLDWKGVCDQEHGAEHRHLRDGQ